VEQEGPSDLCETSTSGHVQDEDALPNLDGLPTPLSAFLVEDFSSAGTSASPVVDNCSTNTSFC